MRVLSNKSKILIVIAVAAIVAVTVSFVVCYYLGAIDYLIYGYNRNTYSVKAISKENLSIHFLQLGNGSNGDCIYIKAGDTDVLIDAGSKLTYSKALGDYVDRYCSDGKLEFVVATHADSDHISGFVGTTAAKGIFERYECETIIQFARTNNSTSIYKDYCAKRDAAHVKGANVYTALECYNNSNGAQREYQLASGITMKILYQEYYETRSSNENDYSVCLMISEQYARDGKTGTNNYLLLGDLEESGERSLVNCNPDLPEVVLYKGGHHGSKTSACVELLEKIKPQIVCICCVAGSVEYLTSTPQNLSHSFPAQEFIDRIATYTDKVYVTDVATIKLDTSTGRYKDVDTAPLNGDIVVASTNGVVSTYFSHSDAKLKDTDWFAAYRVCPKAWQGN